MGSNGAFFKSVGKIALIFVGFFLPDDRNIGGGGLLSGEI